MENNSLKLNLKKDAFNDVRNGKISNIHFETTPFYFSKFTDNKYNTVNDVIDNREHFKQFDTVIFSCSGETEECNKPFVRVVTELDDATTTWFVLEFDNPNMKNNEIVNQETETETEIQECEHVLEPQSETQSETSNIEKEDMTEEPFEVNDEKEVVEHTEENTEVEDTTMVSETDVLSGVYNEDMLTKFECLDNVFVVKRPVVKVFYMGEIYGCDKRVPCKNEHAHTVNLNYQYISFEDGDDLYNKLVSLTKKGYVFFCKNESNFIEDNKYKMCVGIVSKLDILNWM